MRRARGVAYFLSVLLVAVSVTAVFSGPDVSAAQITARSLTLVGVTGVGGSMPGGNVNHKFTFTLPSASTVGSIRFEYCAVLPVSSSSPCAPIGVDDAHTTAATLGAQTGETFTVIMLKCCKRILILFHQYH